MGERPADRVDISLPHDVAVVLFEWLHALEDDDRHGEVVRHEGETAALVMLSGALERALAAPFSDRYNSLLAEARRRLGEAYEGPRG